ncbi:MAG: GlyGly-CTERM sorting domain-containing protein, partial [Acetobacteraceae bacterium]
PGVINYLFGLTAIRLWTYTWSTAVFMLPLTFAVAVLGKAAGGVLLTPEAGTRLSLIFLGSGAFSVFCLLVLFGFWIQRRDV